MILLSLWLMSEPLVATAQAEETAAIDSKAVNTLWVQRDWGGHTDEAIGILEAARDANPDDYEVRWQLARFYYWKANTKSGARQAELGKKAWDEAEAAKKLEPGKVEGWYWAAASIGAYSQGAGIMNAVQEGLADEFKKNANKAIAIDGAHDHGGPYRALGRFYTNLPWPLQDLEAAEKNLKKALDADDDFAINLYYLADVYKEDGDEDKAKEYATKAAAQDPASSGDPPSTRKHVKLANAMLEEL